MIFTPTNQYLLPLASKMIYFETTRLQTEKVSSVRLVHIWLLNISLSAYFLEKFTADRTHWNFKALLQTIGSRGESETAKPY